MVDVGNDGKVSTLALACHLSFRPPYGTSAPPGGSHAKSMGAAGPLLFLAGAGLGAAALYWSGSLPAADAREAETVHVAINQWSVGAMRARDTQRKDLPLDEELAGLAEPD